MKSLNNKNIIITGASQGIGKSLAINFTRNKANVFLISRNEIKLLDLKKSLEKINSSHRTIEYFSADITKQSELIDIFKKIGSSIRETHSSAKF